MIKEERDRLFAQNGWSKNDVRLLLKYIEELEASRDSRQLSAVPSEEEIEAWYIEKYGVARDLNGKPSWNSQSIGYRTDGDLYEMLNDFAKWIKQRGIAG